MDLPESFIMSEVPSTVGCITPLIRAITEGKMMTAKPKTKGRNKG